MPFPSLAGRFRLLDPDWYALHRAIRLAVVVPAMFAFTFTAFADPQVATFASFGGFALMLFVDFPGSRSRRLASYLMLALTGALLITLGTLASQVSWLAVASMTVAGFVILFAGALSATIASAGRSALLLFILPVTLPGTAADIAPRLAGWGIAVAVCIPVVMLVWPPRDRDLLRRSAADTCRAAADVITARAGGRGAPDDELCQAMTKALGRLRDAFRGSTFRPVALTTGSRALIRVVDDLEWLCAGVLALDAHDLPGWPDLAKDTARAAASVLRASAALLAAGRPDPGRQRALAEALATLDAQRQLVGSRVREFLDPAADHDIELALQGRELGYAAALVGATVQWAADADARPVLDRILGRQPRHATAAPLSPAVQIAASHLERHSVWLQNSIRGALGLGLAVLFVKLVGAEHGFWAVLGALSVLRSSALSTGTTVLRVLAGTVAGLIIGSALLLALGTSPALLWALFPVAVLIAGYAPDAISFAAGQAAFTVTLLILFNIISPVGWKVGLIRIEDIALGCAAGLIVGILVWPRGAAAAIGTALSQAYRIGTGYLANAVAYALGLAAEPDAEHREMLAAGRRLDDALRQYLAERGAKNVHLSDLTPIVNGATRLRLAGEAIGRMPLPPREDPGGHALTASSGLIQDQAWAVSGWYAAVADAIDPRRPVRTPPPPRPADRTAELLAALRRDLGAGTLHDGDTEHAKRLLWTALYLQDLRRLEAQLEPHLAALPGISPQQPRTGEPARAGAAPTTPATPPRR
jgi:uncharacterized membrane protein YccC